MSSIIRATTTNGLQIAPDNSGSLVLQTNGTTTAVTIDTSQNVGIGVVPSAWPTNFSQKALQIGAVGAISSLDAGAGNRQMNVSDNVYDFANAPTYITSDYASAYRQLSGLHIWSNASSGTAGTSCTLTERMRIDTSGNVGIGTNSPVAKLQVVGSTQTIRALRDTGNGGLSDTDTGGAIGFGTSAGSGTGYIGAQIGINANATWTIGTSQPTNIIFQNVPSGSTTLTERMRIDSSGNVLIGQTNNANGVRLAVKGSGGADDDLTFNSSSTYAEIQSFNSKPIILNRQGNEIWIGGTTDRGAFNLQCNGTGVWGAGAYTNGSDERIKQDITPLDTGLDVVAKLNPVTYKYKEDWSKDQSIQTGFIAQDLLVALEGKNYVDGIVNQSSEYMSVAYQNIIPILTKAIQEQQTIINDLKARIETLESK